MSHQMRVAVELDCSPFTRTASSSKRPTLPNLAARRVLVPGPGALVHSQTWTTPALTSLRALCRFLRAWLTKKLATSWLMRTASGEWGMCRSGVHSKGFFSGCHCVSGCGKRVGCEFGWNERWYPDSASRRCALVQGLHPGGYVARDPHPGVRGVQRARAALLQPNARPMLVLNRATVFAGTQRAHAELLQQRGPTWVATMGYLRASRVLTYGLPTRARARSLDGQLFLLT